MPLQMTRLDRHMRGKRPDPVHVEEGLQPGQLGLRGLLRPPQERVLLLSGLGWRTVDSFMELLNEYIVFYNERRKKQSLGWMSPRQYRSSKGLVA